MTTSKTTNDLILERLAEGLDSTSKMTHALLNDLRESETDFATVKAELSILRENVKGLSDIVRDGSGAASIVTRLALIDQKITQIDKWIENHANIHNKTKDDLESLMDQIDEVDRRVENLQSIVTRIKEKFDEDERAKRNSLDKEVELQHEQSKTNQKISEAKQSAIIQLTVAIIVALVGAVGGGGIVKACQPTPTAAPIVVPTPSASAR